MIVCIHKDVDLVDMGIDNWAPILDVKMVGLDVREKDDLTLIVVFVIVCIGSWIWGFMCLYCSGKIQKKWNESSLETAESIDQRNVNASEESDFGDDLQMLMGSR